MTSWICMKFLQNIFRDTDFENFYQIGSDKVVISWFLMAEILRISRVMSKSNYLWWRHFRSIMMSSEVKLVCKSRFWVELSFAIKIFEFRPSRISLDLLYWGLLFNFQSRKNQLKLSKIITQRVFWGKPTMLNPMSISVLLISNSWKILNSNYVSHHLAAYSRDTHQPW